MVSVMSLVTFPNASLNLINTVLVASHALNVHAMFPEQDCRFVGAAAFPKATCIHDTHVSVAQVVVNVVAVFVVYAAPLFITNAQLIGAVLS